MSTATLTAPVATGDVSGHAATAPTRVSRAVVVATPVARMLLVAVTVFLLSSVLTFALGAMSGANPAAAVLGETATPHDIARMKAEFGLDQPLWQQYLTWLGHLLQGDLGVSWFTTVPVTDSISAALPVDLSIAGLALLIAVLLGGGAGIAAALSNGGVVDRCVTVVCSVLATMPPFVIGIGLIVIFSVNLEWLPSGGYVPISQDPAQWLRFAILPALALSVDAAGSLARQLRTSLVGALRENYATGAEMRGFPRRRVLFGHVLRNASGPALAVLGFAVPTIIGGAVIAEKLFNLPGIAQLALQSAEQGDVPVILGTLMVTVVVVLIASTVVNLLQTALNPLARRAARPAGGK
ncbi:ABC transporter permease [Nocardioides sp. cx-173]|uniref:ABC transporter permease n=1 Tax=Nocardioides sp. cx-173 TaxID=2898796 RepID=UPI001E65A054|nr:ABC transporter permease [Nocardioides sp. cx-173]MCD4526869.1 ABC transporter permease [Nocardioides sp. cx-173]UGB41342.1 ABC transporter permease [Nocardioides sp. cx-173]